MKGKGMEALLNRAGFGQDASALVSDTILLPQPRSGLSYVQQAAYLFWVVMSGVQLSLFGSTVTKSLVLYYALLFNCITLGNNALAIAPDTYRIWNSLPVSRAARANAIWVLAVVAPSVLPPVFLFLMALLRICFGASAQQVFCQTLVFSAQLLLCLGLAAFLRVSYRRGPLPGTPATGSIHERLVTSFPTVSLLLALGAGVAILYPVPLQWSDVHTAHVAGAIIALWLAWVSYQLRERLLNPKSAAPSTFSLVSMFEPETTSIPSLSAKAVLFGEWKAQAKLTFIMLLFGSGAMFVCGLFVSAAGWSDIDAANTAKGMATLVLGLCALAPVVPVLTGVSSLKIYRSLPLSNTQAAGLLVSFPLATALGSAPFAALGFWALGFDRVADLVLAGPLFIMGWCPVLVLAVALGGSWGPIILVFIVALLAELVGFCTASLSEEALLDVKAMLIAHTSLVVWAATAISILLGLVAFHNLRKLLTTRSGIYRQPALADLVSRSWWGGNGW